MKRIVVIGGGPAGLMAAETIARAGVRVMVVDQKPSFGRKFLMAGKSGLNLTKAEDEDAFIAAFGSPPLAPMLSAFSPQDVQSWSEGLGQDVFTGSSGRVFPKAMKTSPLLRAWLAGLTASGVRFQTRWRWTGWNGDALTFETPEGPETVTPSATVLALGGASWQRLGSDGAWVSQLAPHAALAAFKPSNMGFRVAWSGHMTRHLGQPIKNVGFWLKDHLLRGEAVISAQGLEGGGIYAVSAAVREGAPLVLDLLPDMEVDTIATRLAGRPVKESLTTKLRKAVRLEPVKLALLNEFVRPLPADAVGLARCVKALRIPHTGPADMDEAISTAGGVRFDALDDGLMLRARPGVFVAGEMLDWEAPTGGYLITGCLATGRWAARHAIKWVQSPEARL